MKRVFLAVALLCLVGLSGTLSATTSEPQDQQIAVNGNLTPMSITPPAGLVDPAVVIGQDGRISVTQVTPPGGLVDPAVVIGQDGTISVTQVTPPGGLIDPAVVIGQEGTISVTQVTPPGGLVDPTVPIDEGGRFLLHADGPVLSVTGIVIMMALMLILGGYALGRRRTAQVL